jgi:hypothetical protein
LIAIEYKGVVRCGNTICKVASSEVLTVFSRNPDRERLRMVRRMEDLKEEIMSRQQDSAIMLKTGGRQIKGQ